MLTGTVVSVVVVASLYWARVVLIPFALAVFLCFVLTPLVSALQRRHVPRTPSVIFVVLLAASILFGMGWIAAVEVKGLIADLPQYTDNIKEKIKTVRELRSGGIFDNLRHMIDDLSAAWQAQPAGQQTPPAPPAAPSPAAPPPLVVEPEKPAWLSWVSSLFGPVLESLAQGALAIVLVIFLLLKREDMRDRLIWLVGHGRMTVTTKALDDAGQRISRYLLMQLLINAAFGLALAIGLFLIDFKHALLWGLLAGVLRYVPYIGSWISSALLIVLSLAMFPGWLQMFLVVGLIAGLELVTYNVMEPLLFSHSLGVSEVALLLAAAFWAFLWGPIGLILSGPLTVCLVVLGKYVPQLEFLAVLLGDEQALEPDVGLYQRLAAKDQDEATQIVLSRIKTQMPEKVYDDLLIPALTYAKRDREREGLEPEDEQYILQTTREILEDISERQSALPTADDGNTADDGTPAADRVMLLACPARDESDELALDMLQQLLDPAKWLIERPTAKMLAAEVVALVAEKEPALICIASLPPGGLAHTRYLCKRLRSRFPRVKIVVGRWGLKGNVEENREQLTEAGADRVAMTLLDTRAQLHAWRPVLVEEQSKTTDPPALSPAWEGEDRSERVISTRRRA